jgi:hypothetical protein
MSLGLSRIEFPGFAKFSELLQPRPAAVHAFRRSLPWLSAALAIGCGLWLVAPSSEGRVAQSQPARLELAAVQPEPSAVPEGPTMAAQASATAELDRMRISSQSWRRGGLGSKALVSFTLRNDNEYAVKDVEIVCTFNRRDGTHLTDRRRVLSDTVNMKSRKTFARVPVGFINVNANQAKCAVVAASRA